MEVLNEKGIKHAFAEKLRKSHNSVNRHVQNQKEPRLLALVEIAKILDEEFKDLILEER